MTSRRCVLPVVISALIIAAGAASLFARPEATPRVVDLKAPDGVLLKASYFPAAHPGPGVLLLHQCNRQRKVWDDLAAQLAAAGFNVLTFDLRGFGESGDKRFSESTPQENAAVQRDKWPGDIEVAYQYLASQPGVSRDVIGVGGASCGVNNSIQTARRHPEGVKSLVLLSGGTNLDGRRSLSEGRLPALYAVADDDEFRPTVEVMPWLFSVDSNPGKRLLHYSKGGHGSDIFAVHPELRDAIVDWYVTTLIKTPGHAAAAKDNPPVPPAIAILPEIEQPGGPEKVAQKLAAARKADPKAVLFSETLVNQMGYEHLLAGDVKLAVEIMKLNVAGFPDSPNAYDSLSDAYLADGQKDFALQNARKSLELLAADTTDPQARKDAIRESAETKVQQLGSAKP